MLVLTRNVGEKIIINNNIEVVVLGANGPQVKIGVKAPKDVEVHREEIWKKIQDAKDGTTPNAKP